MISTELLPWAFGIIGMALGALAFVAKQRAETGRIRAERDKLIAQAELKEVESEGEVKKAEAETVKNLIVANQQFAEHLRQVNDLRQQDNERAEQNYRVFTKVSNENTRVVMGRIDTLAKELMVAIHAIPERVGVVNNDGITALVQQLGAAITKEFELQRAERTMHPFPASEDGEWRDEYIAPTSDDVQLRKQPAYDDDSRLHKPCARIKPEGETVRLIRGRLKGWLIVDKIEDGQRCWGWLPEYMVTVGQPETIPTT